jgi:hypothetical protein
MRVVVVTIGQKKTQRWMLKAGVRVASVDGLLREHVMPRITVRTIVAFVLSR